MYTELVGDQIVPSTTIWVMQVSQLKYMNTGIRGGSFASMIVRDDRWH